MILAKKLREKRWSGTKRSEDKAGKINHTKLCEKREFLLRMFLIVHCNRFFYRKSYYLVTKLYFYAE